MICEKSIYQLLLEKQYQCKCNIFLGLFFEIEVTRPARYISLEELRALQCLVARGEACCKAKECNFLANQLLSCQTYDIIFSL